MVYEEPGIADSLSVVSTPHLDMTKCHARFLRDSFGHRLEYYPIGLGIQNGHLFVYKLPEYVQIAKEIVNNLNIECKRRRNLFGLQTTRIKWKSNCSTFKMTFYNDDECAKFAEIFRACNFKDSEPAFVSPTVTSMSSFETPTNSIATHSTTGEKQRLADGVKEVKEGVASARPIKLSRMRQCQSMMPQGKLRRPSAT